MFGNKEKIEALGVTLQTLQAQMETLQRSLTVAIEGDDEAVALREAAKNAIHNLREACMIRASPDPRGWRHA